MVLVIWLIYLGVLGVFNVYEVCFDQLNLIGNRGVDDYVVGVEVVGGVVKFVYFFVDFFNLIGEIVDYVGWLKLIEECDQMDCVLIEDGVYQVLWYDGEVVFLIQVLEVV